jgi:hypothetical protein
MTKPNKTLANAVFAFGQLIGTDESGKTVKCSKVLARPGKARFETLNTIYDVQFCNNGETTIPEQFKWAGEE